MSSFVFENIEENCFQAHVAAGMRDGVHYIISYSRLLNFVLFQLVKYPITTHTRAHTCTHTHALTHTKALKLFVLETFPTWA